MVCLCFFLFVCFCVDAGLFIFVYILLVCVLCVFVLFVVCIVCFVLLKYMLSLSRPSAG